MFQLFLSPKRGWEDIAYDDVSDRRLLVGGYIPLIIITSLSYLLGLLYSPDASLAGVIERVIACFVEFLAAYYLASFFFSLYIPSCTGGVMTLKKNNTFILHSLGLLSLLNLIANLLPMVPDMLYLLPIYVLFIMWRGITYMEVSFNGVIQFMMLNLLAVLLPPYLLKVLFYLVIPA